MSIYVGTNVKVVDKTGAKSVLIICLFKNKKKVEVGETVKSVCKKAVLKTTSGKKLAQKSKMYNVVLVRQKKPLKKPSGNSIFFKTKGVVLLNKENESLSYRIDGPVSLELRHNYIKTLSYSNYLI